MEYTYRYIERIPTCPALDWVMEVFGQYSCTTWKVSEDSNSTIVFEETHALNLEFWNKIDHGEFSGLSLK